jgi:hypothetical protein
LVGAFQMKYLSTLRTPDQMLITIGKKKQPRRISDQAGAAHQDPDGDADRRREEKSHRVVG